MMQETLFVDTQGRGTYNITSQVAEFVSQYKLEAGLAHLFVQHTSASLMLCENADPDVRRDLETFMQDIAPDGDSRFLHQSEGPDDMPAHIRSVLTGMDLTIPVNQQGLMLGTWQGIYLFEHRTRPHRREVAAYFA